MSIWLILMLMFMVLALVYIIVFVERAQRKIVIQYPKRQMGMKMTSAESSHLPLKINPTGVIPPIFASSLLLLPITIANFSANNGPVWVQTLSRLLGHGQPLYLALYASLIVFFAFFYTAVVFNPEDTADNLKKHGGFIAGIRPGKNSRFVYFAGSFDCKIIGSLCFGRYDVVDRGSGNDGFCNSSSNTSYCLSV